jgi:pimeloyl-ACP methyl ester carboxylesterase
MSAAPANDHSQAPPSAQHHCDVTTPVTPVVVFVPGLGLNSRSWQAVTDTLEEGSAVVLLPSMGQPAPRGTDLRVERQAERLLRELPSGQPVILVGHSASCPVVVDVATRSHDVAGLVLVGPVTDPAAQTWPRMLSQWIRTAVHETPAEATVLAPQYRRTGPASMYRGMDAVRHFRTDLTLLPLQLPVEIVRGANDRIASQAWSSRLGQASEGRLTTVPGAAHMVPLTHPAAVVAAIQRVRATSEPKEPAAVA